MSMLKKAFKEKVWLPLRTYVSQGATPATLAWSSGIGFAIGLCPLLGISAGLSVAVVFLARPLLHGPMTLLANFVSVPFELALIAPYMRVGEFICGAERQDLAPTSIKDLLLHSPQKALLGVGHALLAWLLLLPFVATALSLAFRPGFAFLARRVGSKTDGSTELTVPPPHKERLLGEGGPTQPVRRTSLGQEHEHVAPEEPS